VSAADPQPAEGSDPSLERRVAVKMLLRLLESDAEFITRSAPRPG